MVAVQAPTYAAMPVNIPEHYNQESYYILISAFVSLEIGPNRALERVFYWSSGGQPGFGRQQREGSTAIEASSTERGQYLRDVEILPQTGGCDTQHSLDEPASCLAVRTAAATSPDHHTTQHAHGVVVGSPSNLLTRTEVHRDYSCS